MTESTTDPSVEIEVGGEKIVVNQDIAKAFQLQNQQHEQELKKLEERFGQQINEWQTNVQSQLSAQTLPKETPQTPEETDFWSDPDKFLDKKLSAYKSEIESRLEERDRKLNSQMTEEKLWDDFYRENKELKREKDHFLVTAILQRDQQELQKLAKTDLKKAMNELAQRTQSFIVDNFGKKDTKKEEVILESPQASPEAMFNQPPSEEKVEGTLHDIIRQRHRDRRKSKSKQA